MQIDASGPLRQRRAGAGLSQRERPGGLDRSGALVDDDLAPLVEDLRGVVAVLDLGDLEQHRRGVVDGEPRLHFPDPGRAPFMAVRA
jgi:hypothetical protein